MDKEHSEISGPSQSEISYPKVTIITAVYNAEKYLNACITSVLNQSYKNFEYILIDGKSTDNSVDIIKKYQHLITYWTSQPDHGIYDAWNKGLTKATGDWIVFIGADDELLPNALELYIEHIVHHPNFHQLEFVSSYIELVDENLANLRIVGERWTWERFKHEMITWHVGAFHSKHLFEKYGFFDPTYKISGDYELLLRAKDNLVASFLEQPTAKMRVGGVSNANLFKASSETYRAKIKHGILSVSKGQLLKFVDKVRLSGRHIGKFLN